MVLGFAVVRRESKGPPQFYYMASDQEYSGDARGLQKSSSDQQQAPQQLITSPRVSVSVLCSACTQPRWESEWNFNIEDGWPINNSKNTTSSFKRGGDLMKDKDKAGKSQKTRKNMGRVFYHRPPRVLLSL